MAGKVYITYADADKASADAMRSFLEDNGVECAASPDGDLQAQEDVLASDSVCVVICGEDTDGSDRVISEVSKAISQRKTVIPFILNQKGPSGVLDYYLSTLHWQNAYGLPQDEAFGQLLERVKAVLGMSAGEETYSEDEPSAGIELSARDNNPSSETAKPSSPQKQHRVRKILLTVWRIAVAVLCLGIAYSIIPETFMRQSLRNGDTIDLIFTFTGLLVAGAYHLLRVFIKKMPRFSGLIFFAVITLLWITGSRIKTHYGSLQPKVVLPADTDPAVCMNAANEAFAALSADGYVYYCDSPEGHPAVYRCSFDDFISGAAGEIVLKKTSADNLGLLPDGRLLYRDTGNGRDHMMILDPNTGDTKKLKSKATSHYIIANEIIFYQETGRRHSGIGVLYPDKSYDGRAVTSGITSHLFQYGDAIYYVMNGSFITRTKNGSGIALRRDIHGRFIVYDDNFYFAGENGGLFRGPLDDMEQSEKLAENTPSSMNVYSDKLYYLDADEGTLWSIPLEGGTASAVSSTSYRSMCLIGNCLCLQDADGHMTQMILERDS